MILLNREIDKYDEDELVLTFGIPFDEGGKDNFGIKHIYNIDNKRVIIHYNDEKCKFS